MCQGLLVECVFTFFCYEMNDENVVVENLFIVFVVSFTRY